LQTINKNLVKKIDIVQAIKADYDKLAHYHYMTPLKHPMTHIYKASHKDNTSGRWPDPMAVVVFKTPLPRLKARNIATNNFFEKPPTNSERLSLINSKIRYLARIIVDPRFRKMGIGSKLLHEALKHVSYPIIETLTPIDFTARLFRKQGFVCYPTPAPLWHKKMIKTFLKTGLTEQSLEIPAIVHARIDCQQPNTFWIIDQQIKSFLSHYRHQQHWRHSFERTKFVLERLYYPQAYHILQR